jgi:RNA polymerase sigma-70 factor (ECF subfamily)
MRAHLGFMPPAWPREVSGRRRVVQAMVVTLATTLAVKAVSTRLRQARGRAAVRLFSSPEWGGPGAVSERNVEDATDLAAQIVSLQPRLLRFAHSLTRDSEAAADLAQETIARALASQWRFQPGTNLKAWLFRIMRNLYLNLIRASSTRPGLVSIEELVTEPVGTDDYHRNPVESEVIRRADLRRIGDAYRTLPLAFAMPLYLAAVEGLTYAEVAAILDVPVGTVMSRIYRGRRLLISRLAGRM